MIRMGFASRALSWVSLVSICFLVGCSSDYNSRTQPMYAAYDSGSYDSAASGYSQLATSASKQDAVLLNLEAGAAARAAGQFGTSAASFSAAERAIDDYDNEPDVKVSEETVADLVNQTTMDYRGFACDKIMLDTYEALDYLESGDMDRARVQLRRAQERQQQAVDKYKKEIEADQQAAAKNDCNVSGTLNDSDFKSQFDKQYHDLNVQDLSGYQDYINPFTEYVHGLFMIYAGVDSADLESGATQLRKTAGLIAGNHYVEQDAVLADQIASGHRVTAMTYVLYEAGTAPYRSQVSLTIPVYFASKGGVRGATFAAALPTLVVQPCDCMQATIQTSAGTYPTELVCDMDKVIIQEFKNDLTAIITRTVISAAIKIAAQAAANAVANNSNNAGIGAALMLGTAIYTVATNEADLRTWKTLPKGFSVASFPTPTDRQLQISIAGRPPQPVTLTDGIVNVVYVKCTQANATPVVRQFKLR
jgi:hypothetical protein